MENSLHQKKTHAEWFLTVNAQSILPHANKRFLDIMRAKLRKVKRPAVTGNQTQDTWLVQPVLNSQINLTEEELRRSGWGVVKVATFRGGHIVAKYLNETLYYGNWQNIFT